MSSILPRCMDRCRPPRAHPTKPERGIASPQPSRQRAHQPARTLTPAPTQPNRRPRRQAQTAASVRGTAEGECPHIKAKTPRARDYACPRWDSNRTPALTKSWAPAETCTIRPDPTTVRPDQRPRVWTLPTRRFPHPMYLATLTSSSTTRRRSARVARFDGGTEVCAAVALP